MRGFKFSRMPDDQRKAMFWRMRNKFAEGSDDVPKVNVTYTETGFGGGEPSDSGPAGSPGGAGDGGGGGGYDGIPESVAPAFEMFESEIKVPEPELPEADLSGMKFDDQYSGIDIDYDKRLGKGIRLDTDVSKVPFGGDLVLEYDYKPSDDIQSIDIGPKDVVYKYQSDGDGIEIGSVSDIKYAPTEVLSAIDQTEELATEPSLSRLETLQRRLQKFDDDLVERYKELDRIDPVDEASKKKLQALATDIALINQSKKLVQSQIEEIKYPQTFMGQFRKGLHDQKLAEAKGFGQALVHDIPRVPSDIVKGAGRAAYREYLLARQVGADVAAPAALAFGTAAGAGVTETLRGVKDIIELPQQEFHIPPGYQKIWTGSEYVVRPQARYPMEPWAVSKAMGVGMPPGVDVRVQGQSAVPVRDVGRLWGPAGVVASERGYGGVDYLWGVRDIEPQGFKPLIDMPKIPTPDIRVPAWVSMPWIVPPAEILYGGMPARAVVKPVARAVSYGGGYSPAPVRRQISPIEPVVNYDYSSAKVKPTAAARIQAIPRLPTATSRPQVIKLPRTVSRVISESESLGGVPVGSAEYAKKEAKLQSGVDYAERHNLPGSMGRYAMEQYGLVS